MTKPFEDINSPGNSPTYHTGYLCIELDCDEPAGTSWSPHWCFKHNVERMNRITASMEDILSKLKVKGNG